MKSKHLFTPPHKITALFLLGALVLSCSGCSGSGSNSSNTQSSADSETATSVTPTEEPADILHSFTNDSSLWEYLESTYPQVTMEDIESGQYNGQYVIIDSYAQNVKVTDYDYVSCDMFFPLSGGQYKQKDLWACFFGDEDLQKYGCVSGQQCLANMQDGQTFRACYYVNSDNSFGPMNMLAIKTLQGEASAPVDPQENNSADGRLRNASIFTADVHNGSGNEVIGQRAYIIFPKSALSEITVDAFVQFVNSNVKDSGYNWFSIICDDGTGINFAGNTYLFATYGNMDNEGSITNPIGYITITENSCTYEVAN